MFSRPPISKEFISQSATSNFIGNKIELLQSTRDHLGRQKEELIDRHSQSIGDDQVLVMNDIANLKRKIEAADTEWLVLKRQRKIIEEDLDEDITGSYQTVTDAYASLITSKVMATCREDVGAKKERRKKFDTSEFKRCVLERYGGHQFSEEDEEEKAWCCVLGAWYIKSAVKAAHLVPKSLESSQLDYLFGVGEMPTMDPRNGIPLYKTVEEGMDRGDIVIVPYPPSEAEEATRWRCILLNQKISRNTIYPGKKWADIDGKELTWQNQNRPAKRYLYFRFLISYFHHKQVGNSQWAERLECEGHMWATPGPYLRRTMLEILARKAADIKLPEIFWNTVPEVSFESSESSPMLSSSSEDIHGTEFVLRCRKYAMSKKWRTDEEDSNTDMEDDY